MTYAKICTATLLLVCASGLANAKTSITMWHAMGGKLGETVNTIASEFNESQDQYRIIPIYKGSFEETLSAGIGSFAIGEHPNILQVFDAGTVSMIEQDNVAIPVEDLLRDNGFAFEIEDFLAGMRYSYANSDDKMVGLPFSVSTPVMYYNSQAFAAAGVTAPKTWEEFTTLTAPALKDAGYVPLAQSNLPWIFAENFFARHNLPFASNNNGYDGTDTKILINTTAIKSHFEAVLDWQKKGFFAWYGPDWGDNAKPFLEGDVAIWIGSSGSYSGLAKQDFEASAALLPYWSAITDEPTHTFAAGSALFAMAAKSEDENKATAAFLNYFTSAKTQYFWHTETGYVPVAQVGFDQAKAKGHYQRFPAARIGVEQLSLPSGAFTKGFRMGFYVQIRDVMNQQFGRLLLGETDVESAFKGIEVEANILLDRFGSSEN